MNCEFINVVTQDGVNLQGLLFAPRLRSGQIPVGIWIHGLGSNFHRNYNRVTTLARVLNQAGIAFATFDTRGHDWITHATKLDKRTRKGYRAITIGSAYEKFTDSFLDIDGIVEMMHGRFAKIILMGHSNCFLE